MLALAMACVPVTLLAQDESSPLPRFASLDSREINLRAGPGTDYPILWVYQRKGLPVEIVREFENWRRIRDRDGTLGWVQQNLLSGKRTAVTVGETKAMRREPDEAAPPIAYLEPGVIAKIRECRGDAWCRIEVQGYSGWIMRDGLWGVRDGEVINAD